MIKITIEQITETSRVEQQHKLVKSTPTEIKTTDSSYGGREEKVKCIEEYASVAVTVKDTKRVTLLEQEIESDDNFDLKAVIATINGISRATEVK